MKQYAADEKVPMKFHHLYVYFLNPLKILILAGLTALSLFMMLNAALIPADMLAQAGITYQEGEALFLVMTIAMALAFLFALAAEILLAKRLVLGVTILIFGYLMDVAGSVVNLVRSVSASNFLVLAVNVLIAALVCIYYWKRARLLH